MNKTKKKKMNEENKTKKKNYTNERKKENLWPKGK